MTYDNPTATPAAGYMPGFGNDFETEALPGALPQGMNSPQKCNYGLYGEQLSGTAFTAPSHQNERTWCYRIRPSVKHTHRFTKIDLPQWKSAPNIDPDVISLGQYRWNPLPHTEAALTWLSGMHTMTTAGDVNTQTGMASHIYLVTASMVDEYFYSADRSGARLCLRELWPEIRPARPWPDRRQLHGQPARLQNTGRRL